MIFQDAPVFEEHVKEGKYRDETQLAIMERRLFKRKMICLQYQMLQRESVLVRIYLAASSRIKVTNIITNDLSRSLKLVVSGWIL